MPSESVLSRFERGKPVLSVVVPAYREEEYIEGTLQGIAVALRDARLRSEIIVVVDLVPEDETGSHVRKVSHVYPEIHVIERRGKRGVGDAVTTGIKQSHGQVVIIAMGDGSDHPSDIVRLAKAAEGCDIVFTERFKHGRPPGYPVLKYIANRCCNFAAMVLFRIPYSDTTNAFKAYRKELLDWLSLSSKGFEIFLEVPIKAIQLARRTKVIEVDHIVKRRKVSKLSITRDGYNYVRVLLSLIRSEQRRGRDQLTAST